MPALPGFSLRSFVPVLLSSRLFRTFSSIKFSVYGFMLRSLIHLDLSFVHGDKYGSVLILPQADIQFDQHHLLKVLSFFSSVYLSSFLIVYCLWLCGFISGSSIRFYSSTCLLLRHNKDFFFFITIALYYNLR